MKNKLRFKDFDSKHHQKKIGDFTIWASGGTPSKQIGEYWQGDIPWISASSMRGNEYYDSILHISEKGLKKGSKLVEKGNLLILVRGSMLFNCIPIGIAQRDLAFNQDVKSISVTNENDSRYLLYWFSSKENVLLQKVTGTGIGAGKLDLSDLKSLKINLPTLPEQQKIATFLTTVDEKINLLKTQKSELERYKKGVMQKIFSQELRFKLAQSEVEGDENGKEFPKWEKFQLGRVCDCLDNQRQPLNSAERQFRKGSYPYWGANNIMDYIDSYIFDETLVLLAEDGGNFNEFQTRPIANLSKGRCWVNNHTHVLRGKPQYLTNEFLYYSLVHKDITGFVSGGTRSKLIKSEMLKIKLLIPILSEQTKIANFLSALDEKIALVGEQIAKMEVWKKGLLQQMFV